MGQPAWDTARSCAPGAAAAGPPRGDCTRPDDPLGLAKTDVAFPARTRWPASGPLSFLTGTLPAAMQSAPTERGMVEIRNATRCTENPAPSVAPCPAWLCKINEQNSGASLCVRPVSQPLSSGPRPPPRAEILAACRSAAHASPRSAGNSTQDKPDRPLINRLQRRGNATKARRGNRPRAAFLNRSGSLPHSSKQPLPDARPRPTSLAKRSIACPDASSPFFLPSC